MSRCVLRATLDFTGEKSACFPGVVHASSGRTQRRGLLGRTQSESVNSETLRGATLSVLAENGVRGACAMERVCVWVVGSVW